MMKRNQLRAAIGALLLTAETVLDQYRWYCLRGYFLLTTPRQELSQPEQLERGLFASHPGAAELYLRELS